MPVNAIGQSEKLLQQYVFPYCTSYTPKLFRIMTFYTLPLAHVYLFLSYTGHATEWVETLYWIILSLAWSYSNFHHPPEPLGCMPRLWSPVHKSTEHVKRSVYQAMMELDLLSPNLPKLSGCTKHSYLAEQTLAKQGISIRRLLSNSQYPFNLSNWNILRKNVLLYHNSGF